MNDVTRNGSIFVVGASRSSDATLLQHMLHSHPKDPRHTR